MTEMPGSSTGICARALLYCHAESKAGNETRSQESSAGLVADTAEFATANAEDPSGGWRLKRSVAHQVIETTAAATGTIFRSPNSAGSNRLPQMHANESGRFSPHSHI